MRHFSIVAVCIIVAIAILPSGAFDVRGAVKDAWDGLANGARRALADTTQKTNLCFQGADATVVFKNSEQCKMWESALVEASTSATSYSNCSASSYCFKYNTFVGDVSGAATVGMAARQTVGASVKFPGLYDCQLALNSSQMGGYMSGTCLQDGTLSFVSGGGNCGWFTLIWLPTTAVTKFSMKHC